MALVKFMTGTSGSFANITKDPDTLYFLSDTHQLYKGDHLYSKSYDVVATVPATGVQGVLYIETSSKKLRTYNGTAWEDALDVALASSAAVASGDTKTVSGDAVYKFVTSEIAKLTGGSTNAFVTALAADQENLGTLIVSKGDESTNVALNLNGLAQTPVYDETTRKFTFPVVGGQDVVVNLGKDLVVTNADYDHETKNIHLYIEGSETITIPVGDLVDTYTAENNADSAVEIAISNNKVSGAVKVDGSTIKIVGGKLTADFANLVTKAELESLDTAVGKEISRVEGLIEGVKQDYVSKTGLTEELKSYATTASVTTQISAVNTSITKVANDLDALSTNIDNKLTWQTIN